MADRQISCGLEFYAVPDLKESLCITSSSKFHFIVAPLVHPQYRRDFVSNIKRDSPFTRPDLVLCSSDWNTLIVGSLSSYIDCDRGSELSIQNAEEMLNQELSLASHLGLIAITFKLKGNLDRHANFAKIINNKLTSSCSYQMWVQVPMENPLKQARYYREGEFETVDFESPWEWWNAFRVCCDYDRRLGVALVVSNDIPSDEEVKKWLGEPIKCLIFPTHIFLTNKKGYPVLSKAHQLLFKKFCSLDVQFVLTGANRYGNIEFYYHYLNHLWKTYQTNDPIVNYARGYEDFLQCPLQPLMDNLESGTYEVFEKDPIKYSQYQNAIYKALVDMDQDDKTVDKSEKPQKSIVIMVVGAGRGPLVCASLNAAAKANKKVKIYAVEKNPNAVLTLQSMQKDVWHEKVTVVSSDMRDWNAPEKADILVSELLGSFGDNELSPECIDGVQKFLKENGISIPCSYTSYIAPVQSSKLFNEVRQIKEPQKYPFGHFETPYVVHLKNKYDIDEPQPLFTFKHPNREPHSNKRYQVRTFNVKENSVLHGISGYFDAVLYDDVTLSIEPRTHSPGMISWFPIFFPIKEPIQLKAGDQIVIHFWRCCRPKNVWYEWSISKPVPTPVHNSNGRSSKIGL